MIKRSIILSIIVFMLTSCSSNNTNLNKRYQASNTSFFSGNNFDEMDKLVLEISNQLLLNIPYKYQTNNKFVITTFVSLNNFSKTSKFARIVSESLIDEMHKKKFKLIDFRTQSAISVDNNGEFILTRDVEKLRDEIPESLLIVGTYSRINENSIMINSRIINNFTSEVLSTSKVIFEYEDCKILDICYKKISNDINIKADK